MNMKMPIKFNSDTQLPLFHGNEFLEEFFRFIASEGSQFQTLYEIHKTEFNRKLYRVADATGSYRNINHWEKNGLLLDNPERGEGWRIFSLTELCWLEIVDELRGVNLGLQEIKKLKDGIFKELSSDGVTDDTSFFNFCLSNVILQNDMLLVVDKIGRGTIIIEAEYLRSQMSEDRPPLPPTIITINLNKIYATIVGEGKLKQKNQYLFPLSPKEIEILANISFKKGLSDVNIKVREKEISRINFVTKEQNPDEILSKIKTELHNGENKTLTINIQDGKVVSYEQVDKK